MKSRFLVELAKSLSDLFLELYQWHLIYFEKQYRTVVVIGLFFNFDLEAFYAYFELSDKSLEHLWDF